MRRKLLVFLFFMLKTRRPICERQKKFEKEKYGLKNIRGKTSEKHI